MNKCPRKLSCVQYDESCQNWPKLTTKHFSTSSFPNFEKNDNICEISVSNFPRKKCREQNIQMKI